MEDFFSLLYGASHGEVQIALKGFTTNRWFTWPEQAADLYEYVEQNADTDVYCTTTLFSQRKRTVENASVTHGLYADADTCEPNNFRLRPTITVHTSPGHWQAYWVLDQEHTAQEAQEVSKKIAYGHIHQGCDKSGWIPTKLLRVPGTMHTKTDQHHEVTADITGELYSLTELAEAYADVETSTETRSTEEVPANLPSLMDALDPVPTDVWDLYADDVPPGTELSSRLWKLMLELFRAGMSPEQVFVVCWNAKCNKFHPRRVGETTSSGSIRAARPYPENDLWADVMKASTKWQVEDVKVDADEVVRPNVSVLPQFLTQAERDILADKVYFPDRYVKWVASKTDAAETYSRTLAYMLMSSSFGNLAYLPSSFGKTKLNVWALILGDTTLTRKSTAKSLFLNVLDHVEKELDLKIAVGSDFSGEGLNKALGDRDGQASLVYRDEVQGFFKEMFTKNYMAGTVERLTDLYDGRVSVSLRASKDSSQNKKADVVFNMLAMGIEQETAQILDNKNFQSGFLTRFLWCIGPKVNVTREKIAFSEQQESHYDRGDQEAARLGQMLVRVYKSLAGGPHYVRCGAGVLERLNDFTWQATEMAQRSQNPENMSPTVTRLGMNVWKCASLLALMDGSREIKMHHMLKVIEQAEEWYAALEKMSNQIAASEFAREVDNLEEFIGTKPNGKALVSTLYRRYQQRNGVVAEWIEALVAQGRARKEGQEVVLRED